MIRVECYAGYQGEQEPIAFWLGQRRLEVVDIVDRWYAPNQRWFKVVTIEGDAYVLRFDSIEAAWELAAYTDKRAAEYAPLDRPAVGRRPSA